MDELQGTFWVASTPGRTSRGVLSSDGVRWRLSVHESLFESANQPTLVQSGDQVLHTFSPDPSKDVLDTLPRVVHGHLDEGSAITLFDAQESGADWNPFLDVKRQDFSGWRILIGSTLVDLDELVTGVRWTLPPVHQLEFQNEAACRGGQLSTYTHSGLPGICLEIEGSEPLRALGEVTPNRVSALISMACGREVEPVHREVRLRNGTWCPFGVDRETPKTRLRADMVPASAIDLDCLAAWTDQSTALGPLPFIAARPLAATLQSDVQSVAAALEGLHRRLYKEEKPFGTVSRKGVGRAITAAVAAGAQQMSAEGWEDLDLATSRFREALSFVGQMNYADRLDVLLAPVQEVAPGLFGPDLEGWIKAIKLARNVQSHQLDTHDDFGEQEISLYFVLGQSGAWALRIALLLTVLPAPILREGLRGSSRFSYSLANIDAERVWSDYSCTTAFRQANFATPPPG